MMRPTHRLAGAACGLGVALTQDWAWPQAAAFAAIAAVTSAGRTSPDIDQYKAWRTADRWLPDELLGRSGPLGHRRITHWWGLPAAASIAVLVLTVLLPGYPWWTAWAAITGWTSHLLGDAIFGKACPHDNRGPGVPLAPWWDHHGLGLKTGGLTEQATAAALVALIGWQSWTIVDPAPAPRPGSTVRVTHTR